MEVRAIVQNLKATTTRLALSYLAIIMVMSIGFSVVFYHTSSRELGRQIPPASAFREFSGNRLTVNYSPQVTSFFEDRIAQGRQNLLIRLFVLNMTALAGGSVVSYYLARRTLQPIEENMEAQAQFVSDASHELRTPLTALQTLNEVAMRRPKISTHEAKDLLRQNIEEVIKLQTLTDGLLRLAQRDGVQLKLAPVLAHEIVADAINAVMDSAQAKDMTIAETVPKIKLLADQPGLTRVLVILLDNAIKYSPEHSAITIDGSQQGKTALITIRDEGTGISAEDLPHIFDRFYRADQSRSTQHSHGYGIGLALAKKIIDQHNGEIIASSMPGKGSSFTVKVPLV